MIGTVVNIRGCSGAGKTTLVRTLMDRYGPAIPITRPGARRYEGYQVLPDLRVVGDYRRACGGAEGMPDAEIERVVREYAGLGNVIFEGLFISNSVGRWKKLAAEMGTVTCAFLRPPLSHCVERIHQRRHAAGTARPFNPRRVEESWRRLPAHYRQFEAAGARCVWLPWADPLPALEAALGLPTTDARGVPQ